MVRAALETVVLILLMAAALFVPAGRFDWPMAWAFLTLYVSFAVVSFFVLSPDLISERSRLPPDIRRADLVLSSGFFVFLYPVTLTVCGLDARFAWLPRIPARVQCIALVVFFLGYSFALWAMHANRFFSAFVRIQRERSHHVIDTGPYAFIRHPGYAGPIVGHLALPIALGSLWGLVPASCGVALLVVRTAMEDRVLAAELAGYREYTQRVRWRLLPRVW
jgi:protein-S-isoprenylcysteine O-methyltransferase Ste14